MRRNVGRRTRACHYAPVLGALVGLGACADEPESVEAHYQSLPQSTALRHGQALFEQPFANSNGRACATCHVPNEGFTLRPERVAARLLNDPDDPLFNRIDADQPDAEPLRFEALKKGLVRVVLRLPDNMDVIDNEGRVVSSPERTFFVWRAVPSVADSALSAPYQLDGREPALPAQAQSAILSHSEGTLVSRYQLEQLAQFQRNTFTSNRAHFVSTLLALGVDEQNIPVPEELVPLSAEERRGREVYNAACQGCHGGASTERIVDRRLHTFFSPALTPEGNVLFAAVEGAPPEPVRVERPGVEFMNAGFGAATYVGQIGLAPSFNASVPMPRYRFRFYTDGTRQRVVVDLPPKPRTVSGDPLDLRPVRDERGAPIVGPNLIPQLFTTDPGRAAVTGDPADFEAFDMPSLRGIAATAPYFHDNSRETLRDVIDEYSRFVLPFATPLGFPKLPPEQPGGRAEALTAAQKSDLLAFLNRL